MIPLLLLPEKPARKLAHYLMGLAARIQPVLGYLEAVLYRIDSKYTLTEYIGLNLLNFMIYLVFGAALAYAVLFRMNNPNAFVFALAAGLSVGLVVFGLGIVYPNWLARKKIIQIDRNLLFAARHLRIQTTANVPLFESFVSASHGYGAVSDEFAYIVRSVQAGANLAYALEDSAAKNPSYYYSRILWQISNAVKAGTDVGPVLSDIVDFLAEEQRIEMRNYGAQLNTLAIMYLMMCIIAPTIGLIFIMVISSFVDLPITDQVFYFIIGGLVFVQYMFVGLIESRRPVVAI
ncbi:MAG: type II secretion system F family protein [Candidatus Micrarchaeia archaeon]